MFLCKVWLIRFIWRLLVSSSCHNRNLYFGVPEYKICLYFSSGFFRCLSNLGQIL